MRRTPAILLLAGVLALPATAAELPKAAQPELITANQLRAYLTFIASDELEGRNTPSRGFDTASKYVASLLTRWGVKPGGDNGSYFQTIPLRKRNTLPEGCKAELGGHPYKYGDEFFATPSAGTASGAMVYAGYGWMAKSANVDPLKGVDARGKIVLVTYNSGGVPAGLSVNGTKGQDWADPLTYAKMHGAVGVVYLVPKKSLDFWDFMRRGRENEGMRFPPEEDQSPLPAIYAGERMSTELLAGEKQTYEAISNAAAENKAPAAFDLATSKSLSITVTAKTENTPTQNVIGIIEGSDPKLKNEYVALSAHLDHVGVNEQARAAGRDGIYNGADDDGSGSTAILGVADTLSHISKHPKRSIVIIWHCGEEKGLWGSQWYTSHPTIPLKQIVADVNIDMIGRSKKAGDTNRRNAELSGPSEIYVIGSKMLSKDLGDICTSVNNQYLKLALNYKYDDPNDPNRFYYRSDHYNYAQKGIPIVFFFDGVHEDYHGVGDEVQKIDFQKMEKVTRTAYLILWDVADRKERLRINGTNAPGATPPRAGTPRPAPQTIRR